MALYFQNAQKKIAKNYKNKKLYFKKKLDKKRKTKTKKKLSICYQQKLQRNVQRRNTSKKKNYLRREVQDAKRNCEL